MNKAKLKSYAPQARKDFIAAVEARAHSLGLSEMGGSLDIAPSEKKGDVTLIAGQAWPAKVHDQRQRLIKRMKKDGFSQTVEAVAYTWFNRFAALRYMEIHDYLDHGYRVLSSREGGLPEIIAHATDVAGNLPGLNASQIADMKLAGNQDGELYRLLLVAQCNALSKAMPFLFEHIDDESELLLPGNLERTDSVVAKLVESIAEEDWNEVEVIGWLYQFYISEKKDAVIGKVVKSEDIPAATQLFTPNWIVQYLVQNSVGRLWLMANPGSTLKGDWRYYIEPAEQTPEVQVQLDALIQNLDAVSKLWADVVANDLEEAFWSLVARETGYSDATPTLRDLLFRILVSDLSRTVSGSCPAQLSHFVLSDKALAANASVFASGWRSHMQHFGSYDALSGQVGRELGLENLIPAGRIPSPTPVSGQERWHRARPRRRGTYPGDSSASASALANSVGLKNETG
jgi:hypothetical protein